MRNIRKFLQILLFTLSIGTALVSVTESCDAQYFIWGNEPMMKWKERSSSHLNLISPASFKADSVFIPYFDSAIVYQTHFLPSVPKKLNIILHPNTLISNGFVAWAPARSELFTAPARDFYPGFWPQQLAWHEMRHFAQYSVAQVQLKKRVGWLFGEYLTVGMMGIVVPSWYIEGDATASETAFLNTGRGRSPSFSAPFFAWLSSRRRLPDYDRCVIGSDESYSPDRYLYGYWMVASGQKSFGAQFWPKVYAETFMKDNFGMFPRTFKQINPKDLQLHDFHKKTMQWIRDSVVTETSNIKFSQYAALTNTKDYCSYRPVGIDKSGNIIAFRKSLHGEPCFVSIDNSGSEKVIRYTNYIHDESFGFDGQSVYYAEYRPHERWGLVDFARTVKLDCSTGKTENLSVTYKELLPAVSPGGNVLATCAYRNDGTYQVAVVNLSTRQTMGWAEFTYNEQPISLAIDDNVHYLYMIQQTVNDRRIVKYNAVSRSSEVLFSTSVKNISSLFLSENYLYFGSDHNGNEEIYRISVSGGTPECLTNTAFGASFPVPDNRGGLYFSELTSNGNQIRKIEEIQPVTPLSRWDFMYVLADSLSSVALKQTDTIRSKNIEKSDAKPYQKGRHLIHVHSWGPFTIDPSAGTINPGIQFDSQNMLSTMSGSVFSGYNLSTATIESGFRATYQGWYPVLSAGYTNYLPVDSNGMIYHYYNNLTLSAYLPLVYTRSAWTFRITPQIESRPWCAVDTGDGMTGYARHGAFLSLSAYKYTNGLNMYPKLGVFFGAGDLWQKYDNHKGTMLSMIGGMWLPGFFRHDGFRIRAGFEQRDTLALPFSTMMSAPRCYNLLENPVSSFVSGEYACPLLSPDFHVGSLFYLKRISGMISYDYALSPGSKAFSSAGIHLMTDVNFLRLYTPIRMVFSEYYLQPSNQWQFQFGLSYDLYAY